jgi:hypothetical protein
MDSRPPIDNCRTARSWVVYKAMKVIAQNPNCELSKKFISNRIKYPQQDLKQDEAIRQLGLAVEDRLLTLNGVQFDFSADSFEQNDHDWYCYRCHDAGQVFRCTGCWRVYHPGCARFEGDTCDVCQSLQPAPNAIVHDTRLIAQELKPIMMKLHEEVKQVPPMSCFDADFYNSIPLREMRKIVFNWRVSFASIDRKINACEYTSFQHFLNDIEDIAHNLVVVYGPKSRVAKFAAQMTEVSTSEAQMLSECITCAKNFITHRPESDFFHLPCEPPHQIVFARFQEYAPWPGKLYGQDDRNCHVWFFGGKFAKFSIDKSVICSVETALGLLRSAVVHNRGSKVYRKALESYDAYMDKVGRPQDKLLDSIRPETLLEASAGQSGPVVKDEPLQSAPTFFVETFSDLHVKEKVNGSANGHAAIETKVPLTPNGNGIGNGVRTRESTQAALAISTPIRSQLDRSNLDTSTVDTTSNMSFTFNGDSMNSFTNSEDTMGDKMPASPRNIKVKSAKKRDRSSLHDPESMRDENARVRCLQTKSI